MSAPEKRPESFEISSELGDGLIAYLAKQPYQEVASLIGGLQGAFNVAMNAEIEVPDDATLAKAGEAGNDKGEPKNE